MWAARWCDLLTAYCVVCAVSLAIVVFSMLLMIMFYEGVQDVRTRTAVISYMQMLAFCFVLKNGVI